MSNLDQLWAEVGGAWRECPAVHATVANTCSEHLCGNTGKLYAFPALREKCPGGHLIPDGEMPAKMHGKWWYGEDGKAHIPCELAGCTGVCIKQDVGLLMEGIERLWDSSHVEWRHGLWYLLPSCETDNPTWFSEPSLPEVVKQALVAQGWRVGEPHA